MKELLKYSSEKKEYVKPSLNIVLYKCQPLNVLYVSQGNDSKIDGMSWDDYYSQDNN